LLEEEEKTKRPYSLRQAEICIEREGMTFPILADLDMELRQGEWLALIGHNGSGKSTLAKVIGGYIPLNRGEIDKGWLEGNVVRMVLQHPETQLVGETVHEDILFGLEHAGVPVREMEHRALSALKQVGLEDWLDSPCRALSGGQKQLLALAGCISAGFSLLILDEATSMLDKASRSAVMKQVQELNKRGHTVIWITQWMEELYPADRVLALHQGRKIYDGAPIPFFYARQNETGLTACEDLGFVSPYAVRVTQKLAEQGIVLPDYPLSTLKLADMVEKYGNTI